MDEATRDSSRVALITGASYGLGRAIAERLCRDGHRVVLTDISDQVFDTAKELADAGHEVTATRLDVRDPQSVAEAFEVAQDTFGPVGIFVGNAAARRSSFAVNEIPLDVWDETWSVNVRGTLLCLQAAAGQMIASKQPGRIVLMASIAGLKALPRKASYSTTKAALVMLTKVSALDLAPHGIRVNCVCPGATWTENLERLDQGLLGEAEQADFRRRNAAIPFGVGQAADVAATVSFLVSPSAGHITGQALAVDGGTLLV